MSKEIDLTHPETRVNQKCVTFIKYRYTLLACASAFLYIMVIGMVSSYPAPATADMKKPGSRFRHITADEITWIASLPMTSGMFGNFFSGYITQKLGRQAVLILFSIPFIFSWLIIAYAPSVGTIFLGRIVSGLGAGMTMVTVPAYVVEIAPTEIRGMLASGYQVSFSVGVLIVMSLGSALRWSWLAISGAGLLTFGLCMMAFMPESPQWLVGESRTLEATHALKYLRGKDFDAEKEIKNLQESLPSKVQGKGFHLKDLTEPSFYKPVALGMALVFFECSSGAAVILTYTVEIFEQAESSVQANVASIIIAAVQVVSSVLSSLLMDRVGRRRLYITSGILSALSQLTCGTYLYIAYKNNVDQHMYGWIPLASVMAFIFCFCLGVGACTFVVVPELAPLHSRSAIMGLMTLFISLCTFTVMKTFENLRSLLGMYGLFWMYSFFLTLSIAFGYFFLPETKGLDLQEIQSKYVKSQHKNSQPSAKI